MSKKHNKAEEAFFMTALKEEARTVLFDVGSSVEPETLVSRILEDLEALAPKEGAQDERSEQEIWQQVRERLLKEAYATRPYCIRCGTCCMKGSPTLLRQDVALFTKDILKPTHVITIRHGEPAYSSITEQASATDRELIKIREKTETRECIFYGKADKSCQIYESRPSQCRSQECWNPEASVEAAEGAPLTRKDLLEAAGPLWEVILRHEERCSHNELSRSMARLSATRGQCVEEVLEILRFDHHAREFIAEKLNLDPASLDFFFGRPLKESLGLYGLRLQEQGDGSYLLTPLQE
ncbi:MAG: YkgJ family cysteine cluster protein [Desulfomonile tiedjei]|nr:YkgJ family cysteine cluster protein [Desulfomonile tiedjei]